MDTAQIECFVQVAQTLNFRRAAQEMHLSQPTVSKHVAALETELGATLFNRSTRSVELTEAGAAFLEDAREMLRLMYASSRKARSISSGAGLTVAYSDPNELRLVASALAKTRKTHGGCASRCCSDPATPTSSCSSADRPTRSWASRATASTQRKSSSLSSSTTP